MIPAPITIDGRAGTVVYLDAQWHPTTPERATMARVLFDDGGSAFYTVSEPVQSIAEKYDPNQPRDAKGQWASSLGARLLAKFGTTTDAKETRFLLSDGTRIKSKGWPETHRDMVHAVQTSYEELGTAGIVRYVPGAGIETTLPLTEVQAQVVADDWNALWPDTSLSVDVFQPGEDIVVASKEFYQPTADALRYFVKTSIAKAPGVGGITRKFDESKHPRGEDGRFIEATQPRIFKKPSDVGRSEGWPGEPVRYGWIDKETGKPGGHLLTGEPIPRDQIPAKLYHVTTNAPAVESSGVLLGLLESGGLGGGQEEGVSFTSSKEDAVVIQRELRRAVLIARGDVDFDVFEEWARNDELVAGLPEGSLTPAVTYQREFVEGNLHSIQGAWVSDPTGEYADENRGKTYGHIGVYTPEEKERRRRSLLKDALNSYLQMRQSTADQVAGKPVSILKNPILYSDQKLLAKLEVKNIQILETDAEDIPAEALVTTGSDQFLHEVRVYADVPRRRKKVAYDPNQARGAEGTPEGGQFVETGRSGKPTPDPLLAVQAKAGVTAVEKLLPEAIKTADFSSVLEITSWEDVDSDTQDKVYYRWRENAYDDVQVDTSGLRKETEEDLHRNNQEVLDTAFEELERVVAEKFPVTEAALPLGDQSFALKKTLDPDTIKYDDEDGGDEDEATGRVKLNLAALRFKTGEPLTEAEQYLVLDHWNREYELAFEKKLQDTYDSDAYTEKVSELESEAIDDQWSSMSDEEKFNVMNDMAIHGSLGRRGVVPREPTHWITGVETGTHEDEDYARTHALALKLTELRTDELRKERGLLEPGEVPTYTITQEEIETLSGFIEDDPNRVVKTRYYKAKDSFGNVLGEGYTEEAARNSADAAASAQSNARALLSSQEVIQSVWTAWKQKSSDGLGLSLQLAAAREFGGHHRMTDEEVFDAERDALEYGGIPTLQAYVRAQWEVTQMVMQKAQQDSVSVYRGLMLPGDAVHATRHQVVDKLGASLAPPTNVQTGTDKVTQSPFVSYDFDGNHFVVLKERARPKSILDLGPQTWHEVSDEQKNEVIALWQADAAEFALGEPKTKKLFEHLGDDNRYQLMQDYIAKGRMQGHVPPPRPWESDESAIARRMARYVEDQQRLQREAVFDKLPDIVLKRAGAQSTTGTRAVANDWGGVGDLPENPTRVVIRIAAPPTSVLSLPVYGQNSQEEHETVIMGTKDKWLWDAWQDRAPAFESQPIVPKPTQMAQKAEPKPLVIDLQAEDRGKPHWMSTVDWQSIANKREYVREPAGTEHGGEFASSAKVLQGVDFKANAKVQIKKHQDRWLEHFHGRQSLEDIQDVAKDSEQELRALPLVHGTSVEGAIGAVDKGLLSHADMEGQTKELLEDIADLKDSINNIVGEDADWGNIPFWTEDDISGLGLDRHDAESLLEYVRELQGLESVIQGKTFKADTELGLDQFVFMTHGQKHQDYGNVAVIIDNDVVQNSWATESDIVTMPGAQVGNQVGDWAEYNPEAVDAYRSLIVKGDDYYKVAAAKGGYLQNRERSQLFEIKAPRVPKSAIKGFVVEGDLDAAQRLAGKLAARRLRNKVLYVDEMYGAEKRQFLYDQLKAIQASGGWDEDAVDRLKDQGVGVYIL